MPERKKSWFREVRDVHGEIKARKKGNSTDNLSGQYYYDPILWPIFWGPDFDDFGGHHHGDMTGISDSHHGHHGSDGDHHGGHDGGSIDGGHLAGDIGEGILVGLFYALVVGPLVAEGLHAMAEGFRNWTGAIAYVNERRGQAKQNRPRTRR